VAGDTRLLESLCLVGIVPAMCRMALPAPPGAERLRSRAAGFVQQLCFSGVTTLQMLIACGGLRCGSVGRWLVGAMLLPFHLSVFGLFKPTNQPTSKPQPTPTNARHLVLMVQDNLQDPSSLTPTGIACTWRALEAPSALPINYVCRLLAQAGLIPRLFSVVRQAVSLRARSDRAQQQGGAAAAAAGGGSAAGPRHGHAPSGSLLLGKGWEGGEEGAGSAPRSPLSSKEAAAPGAAGPEDPQLRLGRSIDSVNPSLHKRTADPDQNGSSGAAATAGGSPLAMSAATAAQQRAVAVASLEVWQLSAAPGQGRTDWALEKCSSLLLVMAHADAAVKATMCSKDGLQSLLDCLQRLQPPHLVKVMRALRWLSGEASVLPAIKDAGAIGQLVPFLSREREGAVGPDAQLEALHALYNICKFNKRVHLEVRAARRRCRRCRLFAGPQHKPIVYLNYLPLLAAKANSMY
jgi:hypothetical protein